MGKVLAIDYGKKRLGFASGDTTTKIAFARDVVENKSWAYLTERIEDFCAKWGVDLIVFGLPLDMNDDGGENAMVREVRDFAKYFKDRVKINLDFFDERLSSFEADQIMLGAGQEQRDKKMHRDAYAAQVILQRYFDQ